MTATLDTAPRRANAALWVALLLGGLFAFAGFVLGMLLLQSIPVFLVQALFLSLITAFAFSYAWGDHRGTKEFFTLESHTDSIFVLSILLAGGACASLFGTDADILLYSLSVTRFRMTEKTATRMCIMLMAGTSIFGRCS